MYNVNTYKYIGKYRNVVLLVLKEKEIQSVLNRNKY